jgi:hypothetical protein
MGVILTGPSALSKNGLIYFGKVSYISTWRKHSDNGSSLNRVYLYRPYHSDMSYTRTLSNGYITYTRERAIVDYILNEKYCDEGLLIEALKSYDEREDSDYEVLYEVADYFKLSREVLNYWIKEAREDFET